LKNAEEKRELLDLGEIYYFHTDPYSLCPAVLTFKVFVTTITIQRVHKKEQEKYYG